MTFKMGGVAGQGVDSTGYGFAKALTRAGLYVYGLQDYMSRIRGGHNFYQIRVSDRDIKACESAVHVLMPLDAETVHEHAREVVPGGAVIMDNTLKVDDAELSARGVKPMRMPLLEIAQREAGDKVPLATAKLMMNTASLAAAAGITELPFSYIEEIILENFGSKKGSQIAQANVAVARAAYDEGLREYGEDFEFKLKALPGKPRMLIHGNQALAYGAAAAGCRWVSTSPTTFMPVAEWIASHAQRL